MMFFLKSGGALGHRRTPGHTGWAGLKGWENCEEREGCGTRALVSLPSVGLSKGGGQGPVGALPTCYSGWLKTSRCHLDSVPIGRPQ